MISVSLWMLSGRPYVAIGLLWYLGTMMPVIGIVQIWHFAMADRFVYIPLIGVFIIISWGIPDLLKWWKGKKLFLSGFYLSRFYERFTPIIFSIIIMFLALATYIQTSYWKNNIALFKHSLSVDKNNVILHRDLGSLLTDEKKYEEAVYQYKTALKIRPSPQINRSLADTFYKMGQIDNAIKYYKKALDGDPEFAIAHNGMAIALFSKRQYKEAEIHFKKASEIEKQNTDFRVNLANYYQAINDTNKCILNYEEAIKANPTDATLYFDLGNIFLKQGNLIKAMYNFAEAIRIDPNHAESYYGAGIIFVQTKMHEKAEKFFLKALEINPNLTRAKSSLRDLRSIKK